MSQNINEFPYEVRIVDLFDMSDDERNKIEDLVIFCQKSENALEIRKCIAHFWGFKIETEKDVVSQSKIDQKIDQILRFAFVEGAGSMMFSFKNDEESIANNSASKPVYEMEQDYQKFLKKYDWTISKLLYQSESV